MSEITAENFEEKFPQIKEDVAKARFIAIDAEFSALVSSEFNQNSLFDTPAQRYNKMRSSASAIIPMQLGIAAFHFDADNNTYTAKVYSFYIFPRSFSSINSSFLCNSTTMQFLCNHKFDFNKFVYSGIPFLNRQQEEIIKKQLDNQFLDSADECEFEHLTDYERDKIMNWYYQAKEGDELEIPGFLKKYHNNHDIIYFFQMYLRKRFNNTLWTFKENGVLKLRKVSLAQFNSLSENHNLEEETLQNILGFTRVFRFLSQSKKPIIGHNLLMDLLLFIHHFEEPLPASYDKFKTLVMRIFPHIYDTKTLSFELNKNIANEERWRNSSLQGLYDYFKDGKGRHLVMHSPLIQYDNFVSEEDHFHDAAWDSYCTGYVFIRMAHIFTLTKLKCQKKCLSSELLKSVEDLKNCTNVIRCSVSYIKLDGKDPVSTRPPYLIVESVQNKPINISEIVGLLGSYGFIEIKPFTKQKALIAVDNFRSAKKILEKYSKTNEFRISYYSSLHRLPGGRMFMISSALATGALLAWIALRR